MIKILVVDDDVHMLNFVGNELRHAGYEVIKVASGEQALAELECNAVNLAVVDVMMPGIDGFELTKMLPLDYDLPVVLLTARHHIEDKEGGFLSGSDDYIVKPFEAKELLYRLKAILRRYHHPEDDLLTIGSLSIDLKSYEVRSLHGTTSSSFKRISIAVACAEYSIGAAKRGLAVFL